MRIRDHEPESDVSAFARKMANGFTQAAYTIGKVVAVIVGGLICGLLHAIMDSEKKR